MLPAAAHCCLMSWPSAAVAVALAWAVPLLIKARASAAVAKQRARSAAAAKARAQASIAQMAQALAAEHKPAGFDAATLQPIVTVAERVRNAPLAARALLHDVLARAVASTQRLNNVRRSCAVGPVGCIGVCTAAAGARGFAWRAGQRVKAVVLLLVCYFCKVTGRPLARSFLPWPGDCVSRAACRAGRPSGGALRSPGCGPAARPARVGEGVRGLEGPRHHGGVRQAAALTQGRGRRARAGVGDIFSFFPPPPIFLFFFRGGLFRAFA